MSFTRAGINYDGVFCGSKNCLMYVVSYVIMYGQIEYDTLSCIFDALGATVSKYLFIWTETR